MAGMVHRGALYDLGQRLRRAEAAILLLLLLLLMPPTGFLFDNEEEVFAKALNAVSNENASASSAVFDASRHRVLNEFLLGHLVAWVGFGKAQIVTRGVAALGYAVLLASLFRGLRLAAIDGVIVLAVFAALRQTIFGGEWLFKGYEGKVAAYCFVLGGFVAGVVHGRRLVATTLFVLATYFHFLVGTFWFLAWLGLELTQHPRKVRRIVLAAAVFSLATAPFFAMIWWDRAGGALALAARPDEPSPDHIYSFIRNPHHVAPFVTWNGFVSAWLPGNFLAATMLACAVVVARLADSGQLRRMAAWLSGLIGYLFLALALSYLDRRTGVLGKFYLFRPASLVLLIWLAVMLAFLNDLGWRHFAVVKGLALAFVLPPVMLGAALHLKHDVAFHATYDSEKRELARFLDQHAAPDSIVLVDPGLEQLFLDFERVTRRPTLVMHKIVPTNDPQILEWQRRIEFRNSVFDKGCHQNREYRFDCLLTSHERARALRTSCGNIVLATAHVRLLCRAE
jgi:Domain of unknown function (DUF6798)